MKLRIFSGSSNPILTAKVCNYLSCRLGEIEHHKFPSGELYCQYKDNLRGDDVFIIQSLCSPVNDNLMQLLIMADAARRASAGRLTAVIPYLGYARQDRKDKSRVPISSKLVVDMLEVAGFNRILAVDLHSPQIQGFTNLPFDHLYAMSVFVDHLKEQELNDIVIISPDAGGIKRANAFAQVLEADFAFIAKKRKGDTHVESYGLVGDVESKNAIIIDDMTESCGTLLEAAKICKENGAKTVRAAVTHGLFTSVAHDRLGSDRNLKEILTTDTVPVYSNGNPITVVSISMLLAKAIKSIHENESVTELFQVKGL
jgi:ribose-phosphate pyrophosphokinase